MNALAHIATRLLVGLAFLSAGVASGQDLAKLVTKADVEKVTGAKFIDGWKPMKTQIAFAQDGGDLQVSVDVEPPEAGKTVRTWEATMKKLRPDTRVETIPGVGRDAIFYSTRADSGSVSVDFASPRTQMTVGVSGAKTPAQARQIVVDLAKIVGPRVGK
jgi:hypothetical protein